MFRHNEQYMHNDAVTENMAICFSVLLYYTMLYCLKQENPLSAEAPEALLRLTMEPKWCFGKQGPLYLVACAVNGSIYGKQAPEGSRGWCLRKQGIT